MKQENLIIEYCQLYGEITPAKMGGKVFMGTMFGSETPRNCRRLRAKGILKSDRRGKFEVFWLANDGKAEYSLSNQKTPPRAVLSVSGLPPSVFNQFENA